MEASIGAPWFRGNKRSLSATLAAHRRNRKAATINAMNNDYGDRFLSATYANDQPVCLSLSTRDRGDRQTVCLPESLFARAQAIARAYNLHLLPTIELYCETSLHKDQCATLVAELSFVSEVVNDDLLAHYLREALQVVRACANCDGPAAVLVEGP